ncbi:MAG: protein kinase [Gemmatimonadota bacterium]|nr:protein kinase [Gemmatimonadota bacterium]
MSTDKLLARAHTSAEADPSPFAVTSGARSMPRDLLERASARVRIACLVIAGTWFFVLLMNEGVRRLFGNNGRGAATSWSWESAQSVLSVIGLILSLSVAYVASKLRDRPEMVIDLGLGYQVATALLVALVTEWHPRTDLNGISWVCVVILAYPAIAPTTPGKTLAAGLASAAMNLLGVAFALLRGEHLSLTPFEAMWLYFPPFLVAFVAIVPATVISGLGRQVRKARELGSYRLGERLGRGGMGEVFRATHRLLARPAAVKLINSEALHGESAESARVTIERFRREAEAAATLSSPHTISLYDFGSASDGTFYYVMELLDGIDLEQLVERFGPVPPERAVHLLEQACASLGEAHEAGLIHRDVKPSNIFACRMGLEVDFVKVLDFGLVKRDRHSALVGGGKQSMLTMPEITTGTPAFMAPEMVTGDPVDARADVYALGCLAYWLLTGHFVFSATSAALIMAQHVQALPVSPSAAAGYVLPSELESLILTCLAKKPEQRPANAAEVGRRLSEIAFPEPWTQERAIAWWAEHVPRKARA